jgi:hypothetical protein
VSMLTYAALLLEEGQYEEAKVGTDANRGTGGYKMGSAWDRVL